MPKKMDKLPEDKKKRIIDAAIEEFAKNGYKNGSTNNIIKNAGISKGLLFHYFGSKKKLYLYLVDYVMDYFIGVINKQNANVNSNDVFEKLKEWTIIKFKIFSEDPVLYQFLVKAFISIPDELQNELQKKYVELYNKNVHIYLDGIDKSQFREDIDINKAIEILIISLDGISRRFLESYKGNEDKILGDIDKILRDIDEYINILKWGFYEK